MVRLKAILSDQQGVTSVIVAIVLVVLLGFAALVVDAGILLQERRHLQNAVDAAAMAGAQQIALDVTQAKEMGYVYAEKNGISRSDVTENQIITVFSGGDGVRVKAARQVDLLFAAVFGASFSTVGAQATAILTPIEPKDIWPWGVTGDALMNGSSNGGSVTLKVGARNNFNGDFMALDFPGSSGGKDYGEYIKSGYDGPVPEVSPENPWLVDTEPGAKVGQTAAGVSYLLGMPYGGDFNDIRNPRIGLVPILSDGEWDEVRGKDTVAIVGFAVFYLDDIDSGPGGQAEVHGSFMQRAYGVGRSRNVGGGLDGLVGARLWE